jgi:hypothetical protein
MKRNYDNKDRHTVVKCKPYYTFSTVLSVLWVKLFVILCYFTNACVYTSTVRSNNKMGLWPNMHFTPFITNLVRKTFTKDMFWPRTQIYEKRLLASSCLSVCPHATTRLQLDWFSWNTIRRLRFPWLIAKATNKQSEHIMLITFPRQQQLPERTSLTRYMQIACLVTNTEKNEHWFHVCRFYMKCIALRHTCIYIMYWNRDGLSRG